MAKLLGVVALYTSILAIVPALISGLGVAVALLSVVIAGIAASLIELRYSVIAALITAVNIFGLSVFSLSNQAWNNESSIFIGLPYLLFIVGLTVGVTRVKRTESSHNKLV